jgi:cell division septal protein FtsQ
MRKKRKFRFGRFIFILLLGYLLVYLCLNLTSISIRNIYIFGEIDMFKNDQEIIELAGIEEYPSCFFTLNRTIVRRLEKDPRIKSAEVKKKWFCQFNIYIQEQPILFVKRSNNKAVLNNDLEINVDNYDISAPLLINHVPDKYYKLLVKEMESIDKDILSRVSEIEYNPNSIDKERFLLSMNDGNYIYLTLSKYDQLNYYLLVLPQLEGKKGVFYWDSGNYFEILN